MTSKGRRIPSAAAGTVGYTVSPRYYADSTALEVGGEYFDEPRVCSCDRVLPYVNIIISFLLAIAFAVVVYHGPPIAKRSENFSLPALPARRENIQKITFNLKSKEREFVRYPSNGYIERLEYTRLSNYRLCCHLGTEYFVCDYGQGASDNVGLECMIKSDAKGAYLLLYTQSKGMNDARCTFSWEVNDE
jgi:hypothetical protein